jgi:hypothetical protein
LPELLVHCEKGVCKNFFFRIYSHSTENSKSLSYFKKRLVISHFAPKPAGGFAPKSIDGHVMNYFMKYSELSEFSAILYE